MAKHEKKKEQIKYEIDKQEIRIYKNENKVIVYSRKDILSNPNILIKLARETQLFGTQFEPIISTKNNKIEKFESLLSVDDKLLDFTGLKRWEFFSFLNKNTELNQAVTMNHLKNIKKLIEVGGATHNFSVNVEISDIENRELIQFLKENKHIAPQIQFELLEGIPNSYFQDKNNHKLYDFIKEVKNVDAKINIDDYGSGFSNAKRISILLDLGVPLSSIKLDAEITKYLFPHNKKDFDLLLDMEMNKLAKIITKKKYRSLEDINKLKNFVNILNKNQRKKGKYKLNKYLDYKDYDNEDSLKFNTHFKNDVQIYIKEKYLIIKHEYKKMLKMLNEHDILDKINVTAEFIDQKDIYLGIIFNQKEVNSMQGYFITDNNKNVIKMTETSKFNNSKNLKLDLIELEDKIYQNINDVFEDSEKDILYRLKQIKRYMIRNGKAPSYISPIIVKLLEKTDPINLSNPSFIKIFIKDFKEATRPYLQKENIEEIDLEDEIEYINL